MKDRAPWAFPEAGRSNALKMSIHWRTGHLLLHLVAAVKGIAFERSSKVLLAEVFRLPFSVLPHYQRPLYATVPLTAVCKVHFNQLLISLLAAGCHESIEGC